MLQYTGGTTGVPKGAMLTHANIFINTMQCGVWFPALEPGAERIMGVLPFFHVFAMTAVMNMSIHLGAVIIMHPRFELDAVLKDVNKKRPTVFDGVPTMFGAINNHPKLQDFDLKSIKACISGGAPLPVEVKQRFEELSGCKLVEGYGLTECSPVATCNPFSDDAKAGSIGLPMPGTVIEIVDRDDPGKVLPQGETGEICVSGPQVMAGYWRNEAATRDVIVDGRLRTGDVGYTDEDGYTFIIDRIKDLILVSGFNVYPRHVEDGIYQHPAVEEVTVIGVPDEYQGQSVKAFVKLREGQALGEEELEDIPSGQARPARGAQAHRVSGYLAQDHDRQAVQEGARGRGGGEAANLPDRDTGRLTRTSGHSAARTPSLRCALSSADSRRAM